MDSSAAQGPGTGHRWLLLGIFLPKLKGLKGISRRCAWIDGQSNQDPHGNRGNKSQTVQTECRKRQGVKINIKTYSPAGC